MKTRFSWALAAIAVLGLVACSSAPTFGDQVVTQGRGTSAIGEKWNDGSAMVARGLKLQERGRDEIKDGQRDIAAGQDMVTRGRAQMAQSEQEFQTRPK